MVHKTLPIILHFYAIFQDGGGLKLGLALKPEPHPCTVVHFAYYSTLLRHFPRWRGLKLGLALKPEPNPCTVVHFAYYSQ